MFQFRIKTVLVVTTFVAFAAAVLSGHFGLTAQVVGESFAALIGIAVAWACASAIMLFVVSALLRLGEMSLRFRCIRSIQRFVLGASNTDILGAVNRNGVE
jgi:hypothetical protein